MELFSKRLHQNYKQITVTHKKRNFAKHMTELVLTILIK